MQHIRDYSNYLFPRGPTSFLDFFNNLVIYLRGVLFSFVLVLPFLLFFATATITCYQNASGVSAAGVCGITEYTIGPWSFKFPLFSSFKYFALSFDVLVIFLAIVTIWGLWRSINFTRKFGEIGRPGVTLATIVLIALLFLTFVDANQHILNLLIQGGVGATLPAWTKYIAGVLAAFSASVGFLGTYAVRLLEKGLEDTRWRTRILRIGTKVAIYLAAAALPFVLWVAYLHFTLWGLCCEEKTASFFAPAWLNTIGTNLALVLNSITSLFGVSWLPSNPTPRQTYIVIFVGLAILLLIYSPNANTLHRLYRDRLSKAFLFDPSRREIRNRFDVNLTGVHDRNVGDEQRQQQDLLALDRLKISDIDCKYAPYQIINTALNIRGSKYANWRGRNADFFIFSPKFSGSNATRYVETADLEEHAPDLNLATAMAVSGAAASSNMGSNTIKALTPTLTLLNIRLGFWLTNPTALITGRIRASIARYFEVFYFVKEMLGWLREDDGLVYLTDGGHIENLGIYELLRRRCQLVIAVDAEADPDMNFNALVALERHALIDLGVRVDLPWARIRDATRAASTEIARSGGMSPSVVPPAPHCGIGEIEYPDGRKGMLFYIKSSLTGDENDGIVDYKRRYPEFPHETTADQFFTEEQFEVYRSLGFHAAWRALDGRDLVAVNPTPQRLIAGTGNAFVDDVLAILNGRRGSCLRRRATAG